MSFCRLGYILKFFLDNLEYQVSQALLVQSQDPDVRLISEIEIVMYFIRIVMTISRVMSLEHCYNTRMSTGHVKNINKSKLHLNKWRTSFLSNSFVKAASNILYWCKVVGNDKGILNLKDLNLFLKMPAAQLFLHAHKACQ